MSCKLSRHESNRGNGQILKLRTRLGISPWNAHIYLSVRAVAIPLICGNTVILKSSEQSSRTQSLLVEALVKVRSHKKLINPKKKKKTHLLHTGWCSEGRGQLHIHEQRTKSDPHSGNDSASPHPKNQRTSLLHPISPISVPDITSKWIIYKFTGSDRVEKIIAAEAAKYLKPCIFELGGKSPAVVGVNHQRHKNRVHIWTHLII